MLVGFRNCSGNASAGISTGKPPACHTPRFTSSARTRKCWWHWLRSDQVFNTPITGLPFQSTSA